MMYKLLKAIRTLPLTCEAVSTFLCLAADFAVIGHITVDDWGYLARLVLYRVRKKGGNNE